MPISISTIVPNILLELFKEERKSRIEKSMKRKIPKHTSMLKVRLGLV